MMASSTSSESMPQLSRLEAKKALSEVIEAMNEPNNCLKLSTGSDTTRHRPQEMVRHMQFVFPIATQILMDVISKYGFSKTGEGVVQFCLVVRHLEPLDEDIKRLNDELKTYFLPNLRTCFATNSSIHSNI